MRRGHREASVAELPSEYRTVFRAPQQYVVNQDLRKMVIFAPHNLTKDPAFTKLDLITCRNVLIYLTPPAQRKIITLFHFGLRKGGVLFLGPSESLTEVEEEFDVIDRHWKIFRKRRDVRLQANTGLAAMPVSETAMLIRHQMPGQGKGEGSVSELYEGLLARYVPPSLLINEHHELIHSFGDARNTCIPEGKATTDLLKMVDDALHHISSALHQSAVEAGGLRQVRARRQQVPSQDLGCSPAQQTVAKQLLPGLSRRGSAPAAETSQSFDVRRPSQPKHRRAGTKLMYQGASAIDR